MRGADRTGRQYAGNSSLISFDVAQDVLQVPEVQYALPIPLLRPFDGAQGERPCLGGWIPARRPE